ncbi:MAG TPA: M20/M25/M40 family metallo-hydrolase [Allosphingosinicella sp.]|jgi:acetylornithine deacetylase/succinyl-diaminopimelate desuccinylase-like protein
MRLAAALVLGLASPAALAADPAPDRWDSKAREIFARSIEMPTVAGRGQMPAQARYLADQFRAAGFPDSDIRIMPYQARPGDDTAALIVRWRAAKPSGRKPILLLAHMDVVEALAADWSADPFKFREESGYFYGRGALDNKAGMVAITTALLRLRSEGFRPTRDLIVFFTGDEETEGKGAALGAKDWREWTDAEFALNSDAGGGAFTAEGRSLGFGIQTAEKTYQSFTFSAKNKGGHSSRPRPDNAIYELAGALKRLEAHRFAPMLNETTRAYFTERAKMEKGPLGEAMRRWVADPGDGAAADAIEASELEVGTTRTRCVATRLEGGHADNALPQLARATVNCRIMPGVDPKEVEAELKRIAGSGVEVAVSDPGVPTPASPLRPDVVRAYTDAVRKRHPGAAIIPSMSTGATDGLYFRAAGIPVYGVDGSWGISPDDERAHGRDERLPVKALYDDVDHWVDLLKALAGS